jgi:hypothetical protein
MRNLLLAGTAGLLISCGAVGAAYAANPNVPASSPYAMTDVGPQTRASGYMDPNYGYGGDSASGYGADPAYVEGRAAYIDPDYGYDGTGYVDPGYGYGYPVGGLYFGGGRGFHGGFGGGQFGGGNRHR